MLIKTLTFVRSNLFLIAILLLGFLARIVLLDFVPPSLNWDEVSHGYNAYSILTTGRDEWGEVFPIIFRAFGDYKLPVYIYTTAISEFFFGLTEFAVRLPSVLAGTISILFTYLLATRLTKNKIIGLTAAFFLAVEPWGLFISRIASEANLSVALIIAGAYTLIVGLEGIGEKTKNKKNWFMPTSAILFGLSVWTYNSARIFVPLLLAAILFFYKKEIFSFFKTDKTGSILSFLIVAFFFIPMFFQLVNPVGQARFSQVKILDAGTVASIIENRNSSNLTSPLPRLIHNKATYFIRAFAFNYTDHFTPRFLFQKGGSDFQFNVPNHGLLYAISAPFFLIGLFELAKGFKTKRSYQIIVAWLLLAPIASSLTREAPHTLRSLVILPMPMIATSMGLFAAWGWLGQRRKNFKLHYVLIGLYILFLGASIENYARVLAFDYRETYSWSRIPKGELQLKKDCCAQR